MYDAYIDELKPTFVFGCCSGTNEIVDPERKHARPDGNEGHAVRLWCKGRDDHGLQPRVNDAIGILVGKAVWCKCFSLNDIPFRRQAL